GSAGHDELMQPFEGLSSIPKLGREPVEQFRMARLAAHSAKVVGSLHDRTAEMVLPYPVHDAAPGERIFGVAQPKREGFPPLTFRVAFREVEPGGQGINR